jgi:hypothetical protein
MLPLTPANNYTATLLFCGGSSPPQWGNDGGSGYNVTASESRPCARKMPLDFGKLMSKLPLSRTRQFPPTTLAFVSPRTTPTRNTRTTTSSARDGAWEPSTTCQMARCGCECIVVGKKKLGWQCRSRD